jgi:hypothetical protein
MTGMAARRSLLVALLALAATVTGCSSDASPGRSSAPPLSPSVDAGRQYLAAVNRLCDDLLPKIVAVTGGGSFDIPLDKFFAQLPEHSRLRAQFDRDLATIAVPEEARDQAKALRDYIAFANTLDARRLASARKGQAPYAREIAAEKRTAADDPSITALDAAGFHKSCTAR